MSASRTACDTGIGTAGPIISVSWIPVFTTESPRRPRNAFGQRNAERRPGTLRELVRSHRVVGVTQPPEDFGIAQVLRGEDVEAVSLPHGVLPDGGEAVGRWNEAAPEIGDGAAIGSRERRRPDPVVAAVGGGLTRPRGSLEQPLEWSGLGMPPMARPLWLPGWSCPATALLC